MRPTAHREYVKKQDGAQCAVLFVNGILSFSPKDGEKIKTAMGRLFE